MTNKAQTNHLICNKIVLANILSKLFLQSRYLKRNIFTIQTSPLNVWFQILRRMSEKDGRGEKPGIVLFLDSGGDSFNRTYHLASAFASMQAMPWGWFRKIKKHWGWEVSEVLVFSCCALTHQLSNLKTLPGWNRLVSDSDSDSDNC